MLSLIVFLQFYSIICSAAISSTKYLVDYGFSLELWSESNRTQAEQVIDALIGPLLSVQAGQVDSQSMATLIDILIAEKEVSSDNGYQTPFPKIAIDILVKTRTLALKELGNTDDIESVSNIVDKTNLEKTKVYFSSFEGTLAIDKGINWEGWKTVYLDYINKIVKAEDKNAMIQQARGELARKLEGSKTFVDTMTVLTTPYTTKTEKANSTQTNLPSSDEQEIVNVMIITTEIPVATVTSVETSLTTVNSIMQKHLDPSMVTTATATSIVSQITTSTATASETKKTVGLIVILKRTYRAFLGSNKKQEEIKE